MKGMIVNIIILDLATRYRITLNKPIKNTSTDIKIYNNTCLKHNTTALINNSSVIGVPSKVNMNNSHPMISHER